MEFFTGLLVMTPFIVGVIILGIVLMAILLENELEGWATSTFSLVIGLIIFNYRLDIWDFLRYNTLEAIGFIFSYVIFGISWSILKWRTYVSKYVNRFTTIRNEFINTTGPVNDNWKVWLKYLKDKKENFNHSDSYGASFYEHDKSEDVIRKIVPSGSNKKTLIVSWISYWPVSLMATLLNNPFRRFFEWIYSQISGVYDTITNSMTKDLI